MLMHILRTSDVTRLTGLSRTTLWRLERQGQFPQRIRFGRNAVGWRNEEVERWVESRPRGVTSWHRALIVPLGPGTGT
jgi:prophage regulatory protein